MQRPYGATAIQEATLPRQPQLLDPRRDTGVLLGTISCTGRHRQAAGTRLLQVAARAGGHLGVAEDALLGGAAAQRAHNARKDLLLADEAGVLACAGWGWEGAGVRAGEVDAGAATAAAVGGSSGRNCTSVGVASASAAAHAAPAGAAGGAGPSPGTNQVRPLAFTFNAQQPGPSNTQRPPPPPPPPPHTHPPTPPPPHTAPGMNQVRPLAWPRGMRVTFCTGSWPGVMVAHTAWPTCSRGRTMKGGRGQRGQGSRRRAAEQRLAAACAAAAPGWTGAGQGTRPPPRLKQSGPGGWQRNKPLGTRCVRHTVCPFFILLFFSDSPSTQHPPRGRPPASCCGRQSWGCPPCLRRKSRQAGQQGSVSEQRQAPPTFPHSGAAPPHEGGAATGAHCFPPRTLLRAPRRACRPGALCYPADTD